VFTACSRTPDLIYEENNDYENVIPVTEVPREKPPTYIPMPVPTIANVSKYAIAIEICTDSRLVSVIERVNFFNDTENTLNRLYFNIPFAAFTENSAIRPYFPAFTDRVFEYGQNYGRVEITGAMVNMIPAKFILDGTWLSIELYDDLEPGEPVDIALTFDAYIPQINHRTGSNNYAMWFGNFLPTLSVFDDCVPFTNQYYPIGTPFFTNIANYRVEITTPPGKRIAATGNITVHEFETRQISVIDAHMVRDFAFVVMSDEYRHRYLASQSGITVNLYYLTEFESIDILLNAAAQALDHFSVRIGSYPYQSLDLVEVGLFMPMSQAHPGVIFIDSAFMRTSAAPHSVARDVAHQWFNNIVGSNAVLEPWLHSGLASYLRLSIWMDDYEIADHLRQVYNALSVRLPSISYPELSNDLSVYYSHLDYIGIQHHRSMLMFYALSQRMGSELFDEFLRSYYERFAFSIATGAQMIEIAEEIYGDSLQQFFDDWINRPDLPTIF